MTDDDGSHLTLGRDIGTGHFKLTTSFHDSKSRCTSEIYCTNGD